MARYIDADEFMMTLKLFKPDRKVKLGSVTLALDAIPTADVVEVVRCKECKHRIIESNDDWCECTGCDINPDGFCEEGERSEDERVN